MAWYSHLFKNFPVCYHPHSILFINWASLVTQQETWVQSLGGEDPLEKEMASYSSILAWRIPWTAEPGVGHDGVTTTFTFFFFTRGAP